MPDYTITYRLTGQDGLPQFDVARFHIGAPGRADALDALRRKVSAEGGFGIRIDRIDVAGAPAPPPARRSWKRRIVFALVATLSLIQVAVMLFSEPGGFP